MPASRDGDDDDDDMMTGHFGDEVARWPTRGMDRLQLVARTQVAYLRIGDDYHGYHDHAFVGRTSQATHLLIKIIRRHQKLWMVVGVISAH